MKKYFIIPFILFLFVSARPMTDSVSVTVTSVEYVTSKEIKTGDRLKDAELKTLKYKILIMELISEIEHNQNNK